jgi:hypothetical protein
MAESFKERGPFSSNSDYRARLSFSVSPPSRPPPLRPCAPSSRFGPGVLGVLEDGLACCLGVLACCLGVLARDRACWGVLGRTERPAKILPFPLKNGLDSGKSLSTHSSIPTSKPAPLHPSLPIPRLHPPLRLPLPSRHPMPSSPFHPKPQARSLPSASTLAQPSASIGPSVHSLRVV